MATIKFKTNINCSACVAKSTPFLNGEKSIENWDVDTSGKDKVLTVSGEKVDKAKVKAAVEKAGFIIKEEI